ncbi:glycosyltransferase [Amycolatopsis halotolerans]|uniref:Glycosyltransferase n=1 Tax=Amycolatopsis halotolerans TaxID=330083 RepID=A0ABV7QQR5_9PSEU
MRPRERSTGPKHHHSDEAARDPSASTWAKVVQETEGQRGKLEIQAIRVSLYLDKKQGAARVEKSVEDFVNRLGGQIFDRGDPVIKSWFRQMRAKLVYFSKSPAGQDIQEVATHAAAARLVHAADANVTSTMMSNLAPVLNSLAPYSNAVLRIGALLIVKTDGVLVVQQLSPGQQLVLLRRPDLLTSPATVLDEIRAKSEIEETDSTIPARRQPRETKSARSSLEDQRPRYAGGTADRRGSMRVLLTTQPGHGHFDPMVPYAAAFRRAGHEVRVASSAAFAGAVEAAGFGFTAVGENFTWEKVDATFPEFVEFARRGQGLEYANEVSWTRWNPAATRDLLASFETWRPDVLIREFAENGATLAGQVAGIPVICASWSALPADARSWGTVIDWPRTLDRYRTAAKTFGLELDDAETVWKQQLTLTGLPPSWFAGAEKDTNLRRFRLPLAERPDEPGPVWLEALGRDRPLVYATLGTVFNRSRKPRQAVIDGLAGLDADVLLTVGNTVDPDAIGPVPPTMRVERFVPQAYALAKASLVVSHAGLGTMLGAIYGGVPMVSLVLGAEHPLNAASAAAAGLTIPLSGDEITADQIAAAALQALYDPAHRAASAAVRQECERMEAVDGVVPLAESYARSQSGGNATRSSQAAKNSRSERPA